MTKAAPRAGFGVALALFLFCADVAAEEPEYSFPKHSIFYQDNLITGYNPLAGISQGHIGYRYRLSESQHVLFKDTYVTAGLAPSLSPALFRFGPKLDIKPLAILQLTALYERIEFFGNFGNVISYPSPLVNASEAARNILEDRGENYVTGANQLTLKGRLQGKVGPVAARLTTTWVHTTADLKKDDRTYYDPFYDAVLGDGGTILVFDADLLYVTDFGLTAGVRYSHMTVSYADSNYPEGVTPTDPNNNHHKQQRIGPLIAYKLGDTGTFLNAPTLFALSGIWLKHAYRTDEDAPRALPFVLMGVAFEGIFWGSE